MAAPTNAEIAYQQSGLIDRWTLFTTQLRDWLGGTPDGGPNGDGAYPLQNVVGEVFLVPCPAANSAKVTELTDPLEGLQATVEASVTAGQAAQAAAEQARDIAQTYRDAAISASGDASMYATNSANSAAAALTSKNAAATSETNAAASAAAAATSETNAAASAAAAANSATTADNDAVAANQSAQDAAASAQQAATYAAGRLTYIGSWDVSGGTLPAIGNKGDFYAITGTATINGVEYANGDMAVSNGSTGFDKIDNTDKVTSVAGLIGTISTAQLQTALNLGTAAYQPTTAFASAAQGTKADSAVQPGDLASVATSGSYNDLTDKPTLGTAAAKNTGDFATAAQGAKADTAVQPNTVPNLNGLITNTFVNGWGWQTKVAGTIKLGLLINPDGAPALVHPPSFEKLSFNNDGSLSYSSTFTAANFSGSSSGINTGDQDLSGFATQSWVSSNFALAANRPAIYVQSTDPGAVPDGSLWVW